MIQLAITYIILIVKTARISAVNTDSYMCQGQFIMVGCRQ